MLFRSGGEWRILDGDSFRSFGGVHARTEWIVGSVDRGPVRGILTFDQTGRRLHLRSRSGQDLQSWPNPSPAPLLFQLGGDAAAMGFSKEPPGIWAGPLDGAPGMREVAKLLPGDESSWLYSNDDGSVLWSFVGSHREIYIPFLQLLDSPNRQRWSTGSRAVFLRPDGSRPPVQFPLKHYYVASAVDPSGRWAVVAEPGQKGAFHCLDLTRTE